MVWPPGFHKDAVEEIDTLRDGKGWASTLGGRQRIGEALRPSPLLWVAGRWYSSHVLGSAGTAAPAASELRLLPWYVPVARSIDRVGCNVSTAGTAAHVARLGVYNADPVSGLPTTVLVDAGTVAVDTTGQKEVAVTATVHGLHWLGLTAQSGTFTALTPTNLVYVAGAPAPHTTPANGLAYAAVDPASALPNLTGVTPGGFAFQAVPTVSLRAL